MSDHLINLMQKNEFKNINLFKVEYENEAKVIFEPYKTLHVQQDEIPAQQCVLPDDEASARILDKYLKGYISLPEMRLKMDKLKKTGS